MASAEVVDSVAALGLLAADLEERLANDEATFRDEEAVLAFESALYEVLLGHHADAAERFWVLQGALDPGSPLQSDADWYLAQSLAEIGLFDEAERRLASKVGDPTDPFRVDAVRSLLGLYARRGRTDALDALARDARRWDMLGEVADVRYALGRGLFDLGRLAEADAALFDIPRDHPDWARATYVRGAAAVRAGDLARGASLLEPLASSSAPTAAYAEVRDLALLAMARIAWEQDNLAAATSWYERVPDASSQLGTALSEAAWLAITRAEPAVALRAVEVAILRVPDGADALDLVGARGALLMALGDPTGAASAYQDALAECDMALDAIDAAGPAGPSEGWLQAAFDADEDVRRAQAAAGQVAALREGLQAARQVSTDLRAEAAEGLVLRRHARIRVEASEALDAAGRLEADPRAAAVIASLTARVAAVDAAIPQARLRLEADLRDAIGALDAVEPSLGAVEGRARRAWSIARDAAVARLRARVLRAQEIAAAGIADAAFAGLLRTHDEIERLQRARGVAVDAVDARYEEVRARAW